MTLIFVLVSLLNGNCINLGAQFLKDVRQINSIFLAKLANFPQSYQDFPISSASPIPDQDVQSGFLSFIFYYKPLVYIYDLPSKGSILFGLQDID